jgi:putative selenium metabolism hydrolase
LIRLRQHSGTHQGNRPGKVLLLDGHIDTVPVPDESKWTHKPFGGEIEDGRIYGRGTSDMKGAVSAMMAASAFFAADTRGILRERSMSPELFTRSVSRDRRRKISERIRPDYVVIGESSELNLKRGQRGRAEIVVETFGKPAHSANPRAGINAVYKMAELIREIGKLKAPVHPILGEGILELTDIKSSPYPGASVVPDYCRATYDRRLLVGETKESVLEPLLALMPNETEGRSVRGQGAFCQPTCRAVTPARRLALNDSFPAGHSSRTMSLCRRLWRDCEAQGLTPEITQYSFCTNGSHYAGEAGIKTIGFGPSRENLAHTIDEYIEIDQLLKAVEGYYGILGPCCRRVESMRTLIENGWIVDGAGPARYKSSLVVEDELIAAIGNVRSGDGFDRVIDAKGLIVAPGFIDTHSHSDLGGDAQSICGSQDSPGRDDRVAGPGRNFDGAFAQAIHFAVAKESCRA